MLERPVLQQAREQQVADLQQRKVFLVVDLACGQPLCSLTSTYCCRPDLSVIDARAIDDVEAIFVPPEALRALLVAEAELGERILRALMLRRVALIEIGFGGPVIVGGLKSPDVTRLSGFLERNGIPFRVVDPDQDPDGSALLTLRAR